MKIKKCYKVPRETTEANLIRLRAEGLNRHFSKEGGYTSGQ